MPELSAIAEGSTGEGETAESEAEPRKIVEGAFFAIGYLAKTC